MTWAFPRLVQRAEPMLGTWPPFRLSLAAEMTHGSTTDESWSQKPRDDDVGDVGRPMEAGPIGEDANAGIRGVASESIEELAEQTMTVFNEELTWLLARLTSK